MPIVKASLDETNKKIRKSKWRPEKELFNMGSILMGGVCNNNSDDLRLQRQIGVKNLSLQAAFGIVVFTVKCLCIWNPTREDVAMTLR